jgi:hypothetical protein
MPSRRRLFALAIVVCAATSVALSLTPDGGTLAAYSDLANVNGNSASASVWQPNPPAECGELSKYVRVIYGTPGDDTIDAGNQGEVVMGLGGNDTIRGGNGKDCLVGGDGNDVIFGNNAKDILLGGAGDDALYGGNGKDSIDGGPGIDTCLGENAPDVVNCENSPAAPARAQTDQSVAPVVAPDPTTADLSPTDPSATATAPAPASAAPQADPTSSAEVKPSTTEPTLTGAVAPSGQPASEGTQP